jgi:lipid A 4'-phosphatase
MDTSFRWYDNILGFKMNIKILTFITIISGIILLAFPDLDIAISSLFLDENKEFYLSKNAILLFFYISVNVLTVVSIILLPLALIYIHTPLFKYGQQARAHLRKALIILILSLAIAPGYLTHEFFKEYWGRNRPKNVVELGGRQQFSQFYVINNDKEGKSFTSGHAGFAFWTVGLAYLFRDAKYSKRAFAAGVAYGVVVSLGRIMQGGHYFSDVVSGGLLSLWTIAILAGLIKIPENQHQQQ